MIRTTLDIIVAGMKYSGGLKSIYMCIHSHENV